MKKPKSLLLVEDTEVDRRLAVRVLRKVWPELEVLEACDGREAIGILERRGDALPDIILLDVNMPTMNGHEFLETWYEERGAEIPVVMMLTSSNQSLDRERAARFGCVRDYLVKPITRETAARLAELID